MAYRPEWRDHDEREVELDGERYREMTAFRDYLRENPDVVNSYAARKRELAREYADGRETYTAKKSEFVDGVLQRALDDL